MAAAAGVFINSVLVLDSSTGARIHAKYFSPDFAGAPEKQVSYTWCMDSVSFSDLKVFSKE
jgi:hypothetical protein